MAATIDTTDLAFSTICVNAKGAKTLPCLSMAGQSVVWQPLEYYEIPFEPSAFQDEAANRVTLCLNPSESACETIAALDDWIKSAISANPVQLLGVALTPEQVKDRYVSSIKTSSEKGYQTLRVKMNRSGRFGLQAYTPEKEKRAHPDTWRGCSVRPRLTFKGLWIMGKDFGSIFEATHAIVQEQLDEACPL